MICPLGAGGYGTTYLVEHLWLGRKCVAKGSHRSDAAHQRLFEEEARLHAGLNHPNLPVVYEYLFEDDNLSLASPVQVSGPNLAVTAVNITDQMINDYIKARGRARSGRGGSISNLEPLVLQARVVQWC